MGFLSQDCKLGFCMGNLNGDFERILNGDLKWGLLWGY